MVMPEPFVIIAVPKTMSHKGSAFGTKSLAYNFFRFVRWLGGFGVARPVWLFGDGLMASAQY